MTDDILAIETLERRAKRREERRDFFRTLGAMAAFGSAGFAILPQGSDL